MELYNCPVCLEQIGNRRKYVTCCNHVFHESCIQTWKTFQAKTRRTCPLCRTRLARQPTTPTPTTYSTLFSDYTKRIVDNYKLYTALLVALCCIVYSVRVREEIHDYGLCQWDANVWCQNQGYTWFKSEQNPLFLCNIDYCYRTTYFGF